jgi:hypothetical protein
MVEGADGLKQLLSARRTAKVRIEIFALFVVASSSPLAKIRRAFQADKMI